MTTTLDASTDTPEEPVWTDSAAAAQTFRASKAATESAALEAQRRLVDYLFSQHPDTPQHGYRLDDLGRPVLWCSPEAFLRGLSRIARIEMAQVLDKSQPAAMHDAKKALVAWCVMTKTAAKLESGKLPAARLWLIHRERERVPGDQLERFDELIAAIPAGLEWKLFRRAVSDAASSLCLDASEKADYVRETRKVSMRNNGDGSATLFATGPVHTVTGCMRRMLGVAHAVTRTDDQTINAQLPDGHMMADSRTVEQVLFDLFINAQHSLDVHTEVVSGDESPMLPDSDDAAAVESTAGTSTGASQETDDIQAGDSTAQTALVRIRVPMEADWLGRQAGVMVTVPVLTLLGLSDLPGKFDDHSPIPAGLARLIAGSAGSFYRMLTDPLSGRGLEYPSESYSIPAAFRRAVASTWAWCSVPGCNRKAETCEIDHIRPFNHDDKTAGGLTEISNLQPLCKGCHQTKTAKQLGVRRRYVPANPLGTTPDDRTRSTRASYRAGEPVSGPEQVGDPAFIAAGRSASPVPVTDWVFPSRIAGSTVPPTDSLAVRHSAEVKELIDYQVRWLLTRELSSLDGSDAAGGVISSEFLAAAAHDDFMAQTQDEDSDVQDYRDQPNERVPGVPAGGAFQGVESVEDLLSGEELRHIIREVTNWNSDGRCDDPYRAFQEELRITQHALQELAELDAAEQSDDLIDDPDETADAEALARLDQHFAMNSVLRTVSTEELSEFIDSGGDDLEAFLAARDAARAEDSDSYRTIRSRYVDPSTYPRKTSPGPWADDPDSPWHESDDPPPF